MIRQNDTVLLEDSMVPFTRYTQAKQRLIEYINQIKQVNYVDRQTLDELHGKLEGNIFNLVVVGQFKRGKTCLINALLGANILPMAVVPLTSIVTILTYGEDAGARVFFNDGRSAAIGLEELAEYVTEANNPRNTKGVRDVVVTYPSGYLRDGVRLVDTPGVGSVYVHNTDVAYRYLPRSDAALFLLSVEQPASQAELDFLKDVRKYSPRIFFLLNKIDYLDEREQGQSIAFAERILREALGSEVGIFPISARLALEGKLAGSAELLNKSKLPAFAEELHRFLLNEKGKVLLLSVVGHLCRVLGQARLQSELELKSVDTPLAELREKIAAFERKRQEILAEKEQIGLLLEGELERLRMTLDDDLDSFKRAQLDCLRQGLSAFYEENRHLALKELNDALEGYVLNGVREAFDVWRLDEENKLSEAFEEASSRFQVKINTTIEALLSFSSQLFSVPVESSGLGPVWKETSGFYYKFKEEAVGLEILTASVTQLLPKFIPDRFIKIKTYVFKLANRLIFKKINGYLFELIDIQSGRMRYDFVERLNKSKQALQGRLLQQIEDTLQGISSAIAKGMELKSKDEGQVQARRDGLTAGLRRMDEIREQLLQLQATVREG